MKWHKIIIRFLNFKRINQQIFLLTIVTITIPLCIISLIVYFSSIQSVKNEYEESSNLILNNLSFNIDQYLLGIDTGTLAIYMENDFQETLEKWAMYDHAKDPYLSLQYEKTLEKFVGSVNLSIDNVESVQILSDNRIYASNLFSHSIRYVDNLKRSDKYNEVLNKKGHTVLFGTHTSDYGSNLNEKVITVARTINKKGSKESLGVLFIDIRLDALRDILSLSENSDRKFLILDSSGGVIYASDETVVDNDMTLTNNHQAMLDTLQASSGSFYSEVNNIDAYINYVTSPYSEWKVVQYIDRKAMTIQAERLRTIIMFLVLSSIISAALFMYVLYRRITKPIIDLSEQLEKVGKGQLRLKLKRHRQDEFGILYQEINQMAEDLQQFIERSSMLKAQQKLAQYSALKSQIHPHFLANALETIQMQAILNDQDDISEMIGTLGELFRLSIQSGKEVATIEEELNHTRLYIKVQQMRFGDRINYTERLHPVSLSIPVLHFSIQPIIENAFVHGLEPKEEGGEIELITEFADDDLLIIIKDNGMGISEFDLIDIRGKLQQNSNTLTDDHIGIKNVHDQIRYYFGEEYGITIDSSLHKGTTVTLRIPRH